jgi:hypothetical protein
MTITDRASVLVTSTSNKGIVACSTGLHANVLLAKASSVPRSSS